MVGGAVAMRDGRLARVDEAALLAEIAEVHERIEPQLTASEADVERLVEPYTRIFRRCQCIDIAGDTYPARFSH